MPNCRNCDALIFFVGFEPAADGTIAKSIPVNLEPDNARGSIALVDIPLKRPGSGPAVAEYNAAIEPVTYGRRIYQEAAKMFVRLGGCLYRCHYDTCQPKHNAKRKQRYY